MKHTIVHKILCTPMSCVMLFALVTFVTGVTPASGQTEFTDETYFGWLTNLFTGDIAVSGSIVDETDAPLENVTMDVTISAGDGTNFVQVSADGLFSVECTNCASISIYFTKQGFYEIERTFYIIGENLNTNGEVRVLVETNHLVTMRSLGQLTILDRYAGFIKLDDASQASVMDLGEDPDSPIVVVTNLNEETAIPELAVILLADTNSNGEIIVGTNGVPENVRLVLSSTNGGFITFTPTEINVPAIFSPFREMQEAPEIGYSSSLSLDSNLSRIFFFIQITNLFGKGYVLPVPIKEDDRISTALTIRLQPDGSRNLRTID